MLKRGGRCEKALDLFFFFFFLRPPLSPPPRLSFKERKVAGGRAEKEEVKQALGERRAELNHLVCLTVFNFSLLRLLFKVSPAQVKCRVSLDANEYFLPSEAAPTLFVFTFSIYILIFIV